MLPQQLKAEFDEHENVLVELEKLAASYRADNRTEAAARLEQQTVILKVSNLWILSLKELSSHSLLFYLRNYYERL
jgi:hypothetical protein